MQNMGGQGVIDSSFAVVLPELVLESLKLPKA
jgi:hypothetical protein